MTGVFFVGLLVEPIWHDDPHWVLKTTNQCAEVGLKNHQPVNLIELAIGFFVAAETHYPFLGE